MRRVYWTVKEMLRTRWFELACRLAYDAVIRVVVPIIVGAVLIRCYLWWR